MLLKHKASFMRKGANFAVSVNSDVHHGAVPFSGYGIYSVLCTLIEEEEYIIGEELQRPCSPKPAVSQAAVPWRNLQPDWHLARKPRRRQLHRALGDEPYRCTTANKCQGSFRGNRSLMAGQTGEGFADEWELRSP